MTLAELYARLDSLMRDGTPPDSPVVIEGHDDADRFIQAGVAEVSTERRCEEDHEPPGVYLVLEEVVIDD